MGYRISREKKPAAGFDAYFQGYIPVNVPKKNGKGFRTVRVYTAPFRVLDMTDRERKAHKTVVLGLTALAVAWYLWAAFASTACNADPMVAFPGGLSLTALLFAVIAAVSYVAAPRKMTIYEADHSHQSLMRWDLLSAVFLVITGLACVLCLILKGGDAAIALWTAARYILSGGVLALLYRRESTVVYAEEENDMVIPYEV